MTILCRTNSGKDPLGDVLFEIIDSEAQTEEQAILRANSRVFTFNREQRKRNKPLVTTVQCGGLFYSQITKKFSSLAGKLRSVVVQPELSLEDRKEPRLF